MNWLVKLLLMILGQQAKKGVLREVKRTGIIAYLRLLNGSRRFLVVCLAAFLFLQMMILALFGVLVTAFSIWDHEFAAKMEILFYIFLGMFTLPAIALVVIFSERFWYKASGAGRLVDSLRND